MPEAEAVGEGVGLAEIDDPTESVLVKVASADCEVDEVGEPDGVAELLKGSYTLQLYVKLHGVLVFKQNATTQHGVPSQVLGPICAILAFPGGTPVMIV